LGDLTRRPGCGKIPGSDWITINPAGLNDVLDRTTEKVARDAAAESPGVETARPEPKQESAMRRMAR